MKPVKVGVLSDTLLVENDEKRIMASVEKLRAMNLRRSAAAKLIQTAWRFYHFRCCLEVAKNTNDAGIWVGKEEGKKQRRRKLIKRLTRYHFRYIYIRS